MSAYHEGIARMDDYVGCVVRLRKEISTRGGRVFPAGMLLVVDGHWRGRLNLRRVGKRHIIEPGPVVIRGVDRRDVNLVLQFLA